MPNRRLTTGELEKANILLKEIRGRLVSLAGKEADLLFAYRRKIAKELRYDERGEPMKRRILTLHKMFCAECQKELPKRGAELDRINASCAS